MADLQTGIRINPIDFQPDVAVGLKLPFTSAKNSFFALNYTTFDQLKTNFKNLMLTEKGERYMIPDYGAGLRKFLFQQADTAMLGEIEEHIRSTTEKWMPQINIVGLDIVQNKRNENSISLSITFQSKRNPADKDTLLIDYMTVR